jgi:hypothetical protein
MYRRQWKISLTRKDFVITLSGMAKPKMGRPPLDPAEAKSQVFQLRLTQAERQQYQAAADKAGMPLAQWIRERLGRASRQSK